MKFSKRLLFVFFILIFTNLVCFALPENPLALNFSLGTSAIVYGDENIKLEKDNYFLEDYSRFVLNSEVSLQFFLDEYVAFNFGGIVGFDLFKNENANMFVLKYDIFSGIRIYPNAKGFNFGVDYILGSYTSFVKVLEEQTEEKESSEKIKGEWSNGFRIVTEYNFIELDTKITPALGCYWQNMPRLNGYDNSFVVYLKLSMR
jgi:hypothetical protein